MDETSEHEVMGKGRIEAFSDGVIAIAITLLVLEIHVPAPDSAHSLGYELAHQWPQYAAYVVSFLTIGIIWINHHAMLDRLVAVDHGALVLNLLLLMSIGLLPWTTDLMATYLTRGAGARLAAAVFGASLLVMAVLFYVFQHRVLLAKEHLLQDRMTPAARQRVLRRNAMGLLPYAIAVPAAAISPYITLGIAGAVAGFYALPTTTAD